MQMSYFCITIWNILDSVEFIPGDIPNLKQIKHAIIV